MIFKHTHIMMQNTHTYIAAKLISKVCNPVNPAKYVSMCLINIKGVPHFKSLTGLYTRAYLVATVFVVEGVEVRCP